MRHLYMAVFLALLLALFAGSADADPTSVAGAEPEAKRLVQIDGKAITREELDTFFNAFFYHDEMRQKVARLPDFQQEAILARGRSQALSELIRRQLLLDAAKEQFLKDGRVEALVKDLTQKRIEEIKRNAGSHVSFVQSLHRRGLSLRGWKEFIRETILIQNFIWEKTEVNTRIRPVEMRRYYREHRDQFRRPRQILYRMIVVDPEHCEKAEDEEDLAQKIHWKLSEGADFAQLADKYSLDRDRREGGLHKVEVPEDDPGWMPSICRGLSPGEISEVQKTSAGCSIARLEEIIPARTVRYEDVQKEIHQRLLTSRRRQAQERLVEELRNEAHVRVLPAGKEMLGS